MFNHHPLYAAAERLMERGTVSVVQLVKLQQAFARHGLPLPLDVAAALMEAGHTLKD